MKLWLKYYCFLILWAFTSPSTSAGCCCFLELLGASKNGHGPTEMAKNRSPAGKKWGLTYFGLEKILFLPSPTDLVSKVCDQK